MSSTSIRKLKRVYIALILTIVLILATSQIVIHYIIENQESDALVINVAGRQRMLSQNITKHVMASSLVSDSIYDQESFSELKSIFYKSHISLKEGHLDEYSFENTPEIAERLTELDSLVNYLSETQQVAEYALKTAKFEQEFLPKMNKIVELYQINSQEKLSTLRSVEMILFLIAITTLALESIFLFIPMYRRAESDRVTLDIYTSKVKESNKFKDGLLKNLSHEYKTPLNAINNFSEFLADEDSESDRKEYLSLIYSSTKKLEKVLDGINSLNKFSPDKTFEKIDDIELKSLFKEIDNRIELNYPDIILKTNRELLESLLSNLIDNAYKFSHNSDLDITILRDDHFIYITIKDTGIGMSESFKSKAFDIFEQEYKGKDRQYEGLGLGLHIVKQVSNHLGYDLIINTKKDYGTSIKIKIPIEDVVNDSINSILFLKTDQAY